MAYQTERIPFNLLEDWFSNGDPGIGVITGAVSDGLAVLDFDDPEEYIRWANANPSLSERAPCAKSGRGVHVFVKLNAKRESGKFYLLGSESPAGDFLSERKLCVLPPTLHPDSSLVRTWVREPWSGVPTVEFGELGIQLGKPASTSILRPNKVQLLEGLSVNEGERHNSLVSVAAVLRNRGLAGDALLGELQQVNTDRCSPPLPLKEVEGIAYWADKKDGGHPPFTIPGMMIDSKPAYHPHTEILGDDEAERYEGIFLNMSDYFKLADTTVCDWVIEDLLPRGYLWVLGGDSKSGKSVFLTALSVAVAIGSDFLGKAVTTSPVLWLALEESAGERREILQHYTDLPDNIFTTHEKLRIDREEDLAAIRYWVRKSGARLIIIDPLYAAHGAESLWDGTAARRVLQPLKDLCATEGVAAIVLHHITKNKAAGASRERIADSNQILASASMDGVFVSEVFEDYRENRLHLRGRGSFANGVWTIRSEGITRFELTACGTTGKPSKDETDRRILEALEDGESKTADQIADIIDLKVTTTRNRITVLKKEGEIVEDGTEGRSKRYRKAS